MKLPAKAGPAAMPSTPIINVVMEQSPESWPKLTHTNITSQRKRSSGNPGPRRPEATLGKAQKSRRAFRFSNRARPHHDGYLSAITHSMGNLCLCCDPREGWEGEREKEGPENAGWRA